MAPPDIVKTIGRPKVKRIREKDAAIKRVGEWAHSRKGTRMTCSKCGSYSHNARKCKDAEEASTSRTRKRARYVEAQEVDVNSSAPQPSQEGDFHFKPIPRVPQKQKMKDLVPFQRMIVIQI
ncbi:uncharacterized protein LOC132050924 [Lycium ferocissimum]|uniref:uncharacterized protein LOC132050924 n=1 Tax=Lycium ferocissimum TaxID=112874 RepID=UPI002815A021|nr:uncharacterized protein LOC132050924 [Lycium ferocissimum]